MRRSIPILTLVAGFVLLAAAFGVAHLTFAQEGSGSDPYAAVRGAAVYAEFCQACHGPRGEAIGTGPAFPVIQYDDKTAQGAILGGIQSAGAGGPAMPSYSKLLGKGQIDDLLAYLATWKTGDTPALPEPNIQLKVTQVPDHFGDPLAGAQIYAKFCEGCHGPQGQGRLKPAFPPFKYTSDTLQLVRDKHVPAFGAAAGGPLSDQQLTDLDTYMASWSLAAKKSESSAGVNVLIIMMGVVAILAVGGAYMSRMIYTE